MTLLTMKGISITKSKALELGHFILTYVRNELSVETYNMSWHIAISNNEQNVHQKPSDAKQNHWTRESRCEATSNLHVHFSQTWYKSFSRQDWFGGHRQKFSFYNYRDYSSERKTDRRYLTRYLRLARLSVNAFRCENKNGLKDGLNTGLT